MNLHRLFDRACRPYQLPFKHFAMNARFMRYVWNEGIQGRRCWVADRFDGPFLETDHVWNPNTPPPVAGEWKSAWR